MCSSVLLNWFEDNYFKLNPKKCKLLITHHKDDVSIKIDKETVVGEQAVKLLGITIDNKLQFNEHVSNICKKANVKLHALSRVSQFMSRDKLKVLMTAFIDSQFSYCLLIWMFHSRYLNNKINNIQKRALQIVYKDYDASFTKLLDMDNSVSTHQKNLQKLAIEMFKIKNNFAPPVKNAIFSLNDNPHNLRNINTFHTRNVRTVYNGTETVTFRGPDIWAQLPQCLKKASTIKEFKAKLKTLKCINCKCRICKTFIPNLGFI